MLTLPLPPPLPIFLPLPLPPTFIPTPTPLPPTRCAALLLLRLTGCRLLDGASFLSAGGDAVQEADAVQGEDAVLMRSDSLAELELSWCQVGYSLH